MSKILMKGNEALAESALRAGSRFYSAYPITPQTEILEYLSWRMPEVGGEFIQTESEVAAMNMVLGASAAGARAFTSTSGPGFALSQEGMTYLAAADLPAVIVHVQRIGSGLGDIAQGQGDYWLMTRGGGNGDYRTIVLAPDSVQESMDLIFDAFDLAEKYRHPIIVGSDAAIGQMMEPVELPDFREYNIDTYDWVLRGCKKGDEPKVVTNIFYFDSDYDKNLWNKYKSIEENEQRWEAIEIEDAEIILVAYGISARISKEAVDLAREEGVKLGLIRPITLWPFPNKAFEDLPNSLVALLDVEMSILGQMVDDVKLASKQKYPVDFLGAFEQVPDSQDIIEKAKQMLAEYKK